MKLASPPRPKPRPPLARALRRRRRELDLSQADIGRCAGLSVSYLSLIESGKRYPPPDVLLKLCECLELDARRIARLGA